MTPEAIITQFMQEQYSDERLAALLAHAGDGKLSYVSCCCFIGIPTADHALRGKFSSSELPISFDSHVTAARILPGGFEAEQAYLCLWCDPSGDRDAQRRAKLIPLVKAEMNRRAELREAQECELVTV